MAASMTAQAYPNRAFTGVSSRSDKLDAETRTVAVRVEIRPATASQTRILHSRANAGGSESALFVPQEAVQDVNGQATIFIEKKPGQYEPRAVESGRQLDGLLQIQRGLQGGNASSAPAASSSINSSSRPSPRE